MLSVDFFIHSEFFGTYEQDNNTSNGKEAVEWLVLEVKDGKVLFISKYVLDCKQYNISYTDVTWETCTLREWLNSDFINAAFSADEKEMIPTVTAGGGCGRPAIISLLPPVSTTMATST